MFVLLNLLWAEPSVIVTNVSYIVCFKVPGAAESAQHVRRPAGDGCQAAGGAAQVPADEQRDGVRHQGGPRAALHPSARQLLQGKFCFAGLSLLCFIHLGALSAGRFCPNWMACVLLPCRSLKVETSILSIQSLCVISNNIEVYKDPVPRAKKIPYGADKLEAREENRIVYESLYWLKV